MTPTTSLLGTVAALVARVGFVNAARTLGIGREALARVLAGQPVRAGTLALIERNLGTSPPARPAA